MKKTIDKKLEMAEEHVLRGRSLSHISEENEGYDISRLKYLINLYKKHGKEPFMDREDGVYKRDYKTLILSIKQKPICIK